MPAYTYRAKDDEGRTRTGVLEAADDVAADASLRRQGLYVISVAEASRPLADPPPRRLARRDLIMFTVQLGTLLRAGIALNTGLADFARDARSPQLAAVARHVLASLEGGAMLSEAMGRAPQIFPDVYVAVIRAGETTGHLDHVLFDLVKSLEWQESIRRHVRQATIYPVMVLIAFGVLMSFLLLFVFPRFKVMFDRIRVPLPLPTRVLLEAGAFLQGYWATLVLALVAAVLAYQLALATPGGRLLVDGWKLRLPAVGQVLRHVALARFAHHMETLHRAGVNFVLALEVLERVVGNAAIARAVAAVREQVIGGVSFADALASTGQFPPLVLRMVATGEMSGSLEESLRRITEYYDREVPDTVRRFLAFLEPAMIALLAVVVLAAMLAVYLPIYSLMTSVRSRPGQR